VVELRGLKQYDDYRAALVTLARTGAAALDRLEADPRRSEYTIATLARVHLGALGELRPSDIRSDDAFTALLVGMTNAMTLSATSPADADALDPRPVRSPTTAPRAINPN